MNHQSFEEWLQSPTQGAIPLSADIQEQLNQRCPCMSKPLAECDCQSENSQPTDWERQALCDDLATAQMFLQAAYDAATKAKLGATHNDLYMVICDAFNACSEALEHINDAPDEVCDVALSNSNLPPTNDEIQSPESAS
jgi:hypothetical protein